MTRIVFGVFLATVLLLLYVHEQISLFRVSYLIESKSETLVRLAEEHRQLKFELDQLKAPRLLEEKMKELSLQLTLPDEIRVVRTTIPEIETPVDNVSMQPATGRVFQFLGHWVDVAQAKTDN